LCFWRERGCACAFELGLELVDVAQELCAPFAFELEGAFAFGVLGVEGAFDLGFELCDVGEQVALGELRDRLPFSFGELAPDRAFLFLNTDAGGGLGELQQLLAELGEFAPRLIEFVRVDERADFGDLHAQDLACEFYACAPDCERVGCLCRARFCAGFGCAEVG